MNSCVYAPPSPQYLQVRRLLMRFLALNVMLFKSFLQGTYEYVQNILLNIMQVLFTKTFKGYRPILLFSLDFQKIQ